jgi:hypothetical protein
MGTLLSKVGAVLAPGVRVPTPDKTIVRAGGAVDSRRVPGPTPAHVLGRYQGEVP